MTQNPEGTTAHMEPETTSGSWKARPVLAWMIRAALIIVPLVVSWSSVRLAIRVVPRPDGLERTIVWVAGTIALSMLVYQLTRRLIRRFSSLGVLFSLSLTFPDAAPSRLRAGLRSGRVDDLQRRLSGDDETALEPRLKAKRMADLVTMVSRRELLRTRGHSDRVRSYSELIGTEIGLSEEDMHRLRWATLLHDIGMLDVPARVLDKRGTLDADEGAAMREHPVHAIAYLRPFSDWLGPWRLAATEHHERWDGAGYPAGLAGEEISLAGRIVAVADAYEGMTGPRSYRKSMTPAAARQELVDNAGSQFDPEIVRAFLNVGIRRSRAALGPLGALLELPAQLATIAPAAAASAGVVAASAVAVVAMTVVPPAVSSDVVIAPAAVERLVDESTTTSTSTSTTTEPSPATTTAPRSTTSTTTTTTTTALATTTLPAPAPIPTTTTAAPTTTLAPTTTTTTEPPAYPTTPTTTVAPYPTTGP